MPQYAGYCFQFLLCIAVLCRRSRFFPLPHEFLQNQEKGSNPEVGKIKGSKEPCGLPAFFFFSFQARRFLGISKPKCHLAPVPKINVSISLAVRNKMFPIVQGDFSLSGWPPHCLASSPVTLSAGCTSPGGQVSGVFLPCSCSRGAPRAALVLGVKLLSGMCSPRGAAHRSVRAHGEGQAQQRRLPDKATPSSLVTMGYTYTKYGKLTWFREDNLQSCLFWMLQKERKALWQVGAAVKCSRINTSLQAAVETKTGSAAALPTS